MNPDKLLFEDFFPRLVECGPVRIERDPSNWDDSDSVLYHIKVGERHIGGHFLNRGDVKCIQKIAAEYKKREPKRSEDAPSTVEVQLAAEQAANEVTA